MPDNKPTNSEESAPYDVVHKPIIAEAIKNNNPMQDEIDNIIAAKKSIIDILNENGKYTISEEDFDNTLKYLVPPELKAGGSWSVGKNEKLSYEEIIPIVQKIDNIRADDAPFCNDSPRIFVTPKPPPNNSKESIILKAMIAASRSENMNFIFDDNASYAPNVDSIIITQSFFDKVTKEELKGSLAHELWHRNNVIPNGITKVEYSESKAIPPALMSKFASICKVDLIDGKIPANLSPQINSDDTSKECRKIIEEVNDKRTNAANAVLDKRNQISQAGEFAADAAAAQAGYGDALNSLFLSNPSCLTSDTHPTSYERIENILKNQANPLSSEDYRNHSNIKTICEDFNKIAHNFNKFASQMKNADYRNKTPTTATSAPAKSTDLGH